MQLLAPTQSPLRQLQDIHGLPIQIGQGRKVLLSLFREATCPFCNFRVYDLTNNYPGLNSLGLDIVVIFKSEAEDVRQFIARRPRPFRMVADPQGDAHQLFEVNHSMLGKLKAMLLRMPTMLRGMGMVGMRGMASGNLMPADFLIDEQGTIVETYYGKDAGDHIPMERVELFAVRGMASRPATNQMATA
ncbi:MAG: redoxin domain-containing protein [Gammaproteobacteria bacterium]|nr:redoxin domain-containing protein [Gammaproteobacteria bacterium]MBU1446883.1 redoxin domain-containing protein [Gammaproteobacteria bacterium]